MCIGDVLVLCLAIYINNGNHIKKSFTLQIGFILSKIIEDYQIGLPTVLIRKKSIKNLNKTFNDKYNLISDFDFILHFSKKNCL